MGAETGTLDRRIVFLRPQDQDDGLATVPGGVAAEIGRRWASKTDISDGEQLRAAQQGQSVTAWFVVRSDSVTRTVTGKDFIVLLERDAQPISDGTPYQVTGTKEIGRRDRIEITAVARPDVPVPA